MTDKHVQQFIDSVIPGEIDLAITPGGRVGDASPLGTHGPRRLTDYEREIAHALVRKRGFSKSHAIATAKNATKKWARGGGKVRPQVRAGAAKSLAESAALANGPSSTAVHNVVDLATKLRAGSIPSGKGKGKFPITDQHSVQSAARLVGKAKGVSRKTVVTHIRREAKRRGLALPKSWQHGT